MAVVTLYRDGDVAEVNSEHKPTYENFLANGWTHEPAPSPANTETADPSEDLGADAAPEQPTSSRGRKRK